MFRKSSPEPMAPAPRMERHERREQSLLQSGVKIEGDLVADGDVRIEGQLIGTAKVSGTLTIGAKAEIEGVFTGSDVIVHGQLRGTVHAQTRIHLAPGAKVTADLYCSSLVIEDGVFFHGSSNMGDKSQPKATAQTGTRQEGFGNSGAQGLIGQKDMAPDAKTGTMPSGAAAGASGMPKPGYSAERTPAPAGATSQGGRDGKSPGMK